MGIGKDKKRTAMYHGSSIDRTQPQLLRLGKQEKEVEIVSRGLKEEESYRVKPRPLGPGFRTAGTEAPELEEGP